MRYTAFFLVLAAMATNLAVVTVLEPRRFPTVGESASTDVVLVQPGATEFHHGACHLLSPVEAASAVRMSRKDAEESGYHPCDECFGK